jgi:hypothetical protein
MRLTAATTGSTNSWQPSTPGRRMRAAGATRLANRYYDSSESAGNPPPRGRTSREYARAGPWWESDGPPGGEPVERHGCAQGHWAKTTVCSSALLAKEMESLSIADRASHAYQLSCSAVDANGGSGARRCSPSHSHASDSDQPPHIQGLRDLTALAIPDLALPHRFHGSVRASHERPRIRVGGRPRAAADRPSGLKIVSKRRPYVLQLAPAVPLVTRVQLRAESSWLGSSPAHLPRTWQLEYLWLVWPDDKSLRSRTDHDMPGRFQREP